MIGPFPLDLLWAAAGVGWAAWVFLAVRGAVKS